MEEESSSFLHTCLETVDRYLLKYTNVFMINHFDCYSELCIQFFGRLKGQLQRVTFITPVVLGKSSWTTLQLGVVADSVVLNLTSGILLLSVVEPEGGECTALL